MFRVTFPRGYRPQIIFACEHCTTLALGRIAAAHSSPIDRFNPSYACDLRYDGCKNEEGKMISATFSSVWVCVDCYLTHHYGAQKNDGKWFAGESDTPCDREPLNRLSDSEIADNTNSETGEGINDFSRYSCDGCGSTLGGSRYRLAVFPQ
jgi:hypothetical protein